MDFGCFWRVSGSGWRQGGKPWEGLFLPKTGPRKSRARRAPCHRQGAADRKAQAPLPPAPRGLDFGAWRLTRGVYMSAFDPWRVSGSHSCDFGGLLTSFWALGVSFLSFCGFFGGRFGLLGLLLDVFG